MRETTLKDIAMKKIRIQALLKTLSLASFTISLALLVSGCSPSHKSSAPTVKPSANPNTADKNQNKDTETKISHLIEQMTLDEKLSLIHANSKFTVAGIERLGIKEMWLSDGPHGVREQISRHSWDSANWDDDHSTYLPTLTAVAASFDRDIATLHGTVLGKEARDRGKDIILGPGVNLARLPTYGRNFEYFGEDPILAGKLAAYEIKAIQEQDVAACVKHYALNTQELNRNGVNAQPDDRTLREVYLPAFEAAVKEGGVLTVMGAYNEYNGTNANQSRKLVNDILKTEWGFQGLLMTDWNVRINSYDAAMAGLDLEMGTNVESYDDYHFAKPLKKLIEDGKVPMSVLDDKVRRVLRVQFAIGMMDDNRKPGARNTPEHQQAAREIAEAGVVLLKNDNNLLPLDPKTINNVLVMGPNATQRHGRGGGSSEVKSPYEITPLEGLKSALGDNVNFTYLKVGKDQEVQPMSPNYVLTRNWGSGTPAWNVHMFNDAQRSQHKKSIQWNTPDKSWGDGEAIEHLVIEAEIRPLVTGTHTFQLFATGIAGLQLDGKTLIKPAEMNGNIRTYSAELAANTTYKVRALYSGANSGANHITLGWEAPGQQKFATTKEYQAAAEKADLVIYFGGLSHADDREARDRENMKMPGRQDEVISALAKSNTNTVVFLVAGSAVEMPWIENINTLVWGWYAGLEAGNAYANVLLGKTNPGAKLPITLPRRLEDTAPIMLDDYNAKDSFYKEGILIGYRWFEAKKIQPLFPFGHGLSYTSFELSNATAPANAPMDVMTVPVTVDVTNTGKRAGSEVVQLYVTDNESSVPQPVKAFKDFQKVHLQPGETKSVTLTLSRRDFSFWDVNTNDWKLEPGDFTLHIGTSSQEIHSQHILTIQ